MRHIGVERRAEERQPAGDGRPDVGPEAERPPRHLRHAGKAAVQFDRVEFLAVALNQIHHCLEHGILRMALEELVAHQIVARLFRRCAAQRIDQAILAHAGGAGFGQRRHQDRRPHIDGRIGHHQLGVGPGDQPVFRRRRRDLLRRKAFLQPRIGVFRSDARIGRPELAGLRQRLARRLAPMGRGRGFIERIDRDRAEHAEFHRHRFLERRAALRLLDVMGERRPWQRNAAALGLGRGRLRLGAAHRRHAAFAARDALCGLVQIADRALAADRAVIAMRWFCAQPIGEQLFGIAVAPAQEIDDVERAEFAEQFCAAVGLRAPHGLLEQGERLESVGDFLWPVDDFADADDDGDAVFGEGRCCHFFLLRFLGVRSRRRPSRPSLRCGSLRVTATGMPSS